MPSLPAPSRRALIAYVPLLTHSKIKESASERQMSVSEYLHWLIDRELGIDSRAHIKHKRRRQPAERAA